VRAVRSAPPGVEVVDVADPESGDGLITVRSASICASDLLYIGWGLRMVLGHELAGTTADGTAVAVEAMFGCGTCESCRRGQFNHCPTMADQALGVSIDGGMSQYFNAPTASQVPLPPGLDIRDACLVEPTAVAGHGLRVGGVGPDTTVGVVGGGAIGLLAVASARARGAPEVGLEARYAHQVEAGERLGATRATGGYDVVVEAGGSESSVARAVELVRPEGTVLILGVFNPGTAFPYTEALTKEARVVSAMGYCRYDGRRDFDDAAGLLAGHPDLAEIMITHRFPLEDAEEAFRVAADKASGAIRVVLEPSPG
jgi:threonine dehydrogenase-like Zn-dependent dehydrogenase